MARKPINFVAQQASVTALFTVAAVGVAFLLNRIPAPIGSSFIDWSGSVVAGLFVRAFGPLQQIGTGFGIGFGLLLLARVCGVFSKPIQEGSWSWKQSKREIVVSLFWLWCASILGMGTALLIGAGFSRIYTDVNDYGWVYTILSVPLLMVLFDAWYYFLHRAMHKYPRIYINVHAIHHSSTRPTFLTAYQMSPLEHMIIWVFFSAVIAVVPLHPGAILCFAILGNIKSFLGHCGYEAYPRIFMSRWLSWISVSTHHDLHHTAYRCNYSYFFTYWDRLLGTLHPQYVEKYEAARARRESDRNVGAGAARSGAL
jgi:lathosterol oxidase